MKTVAQTLIGMNLNGRFETQDEIADYVCDVFGVYHTPISPDGQTPNTCQGPCACSGWCRQWSEASELHKIKNVAYVLMRRAVLIAIEEVGVELKGSENVIWYKGRPS